MTPANDSLTSRLLAVMSAEQWLEVARGIQDVQARSGFGNVIVELAGGKPRHVLVVESREMPQTRSTANRVVRLNSLLAGGDPAGG